MDYPTTTMEARVARCYVCDEVNSKTRMVCVGWDGKNEGMYIFRCDDCGAGSDKWLKFFAHKSRVGNLYRGLKEKHEVDRMVEEAAKKERAAANRSRRREALHAEGEPEGGSTAPARPKGGVSGKKSWRIARVRRARR